METTKNTLKNLREKQSIFIESQIKHKRIIAKDIMIEPTFLYLEDDIETILEKLQSEEINYCIVVDDKKHFIGEISDEMLLNIIAHFSLKEPLVKILDIGYKRSINYTKTKDYVKKHKNVITPNTPLYEIMKLIDKKGFHFIPVLDKEKKVIGLVTPSSIIRFIIKK